MSYPRHNRRFRITEVMGFLLFLPLYKLNSLEYLLPSLDKAMDVYLVVSALILLGIFLIRVHKVDTMFILSCSYFAFLGVSTVINKQNVIQFAVFAASHIAYYLYIYIFLVHYRMDARMILKVLKLYLIANTVLSFVFPDGMYTSYSAIGTFYSNENYLLGSKNIYFPFLMFVLVLNEIWPNKNPRIAKWERITLTVLCLYNIVFVSKSATGIIGVILICVFPLIERFLRNPRIIYLYSISLMTVFTGVVLLQNAEGLMTMIGTFMGKTVDFSGRTFMWKSAISDIIQNPLLGIGYRGAVQYGEWWQLYAPHNKYLWIAWTGGLLSAAVIVILVARCVKRVLEIYHHKNARYLLWVLFVVGITCLAESYDADKLIFGLLVIMNYSKRILMRPRRKYGVILYGKENQFKY